MVNRFKISKYTTTFWLTRGFFSSLFASAFLYLSWMDWSHPLINTILGITALYLLLAGDQKSWTIFGFFIGVFWFWWIGMSFREYGFAWAMPIGVILIGLIYALIFGVAAKLSIFVESRYYISSTWIKILFILCVSYIHPFGFDWFKPELMFVQSYIGVAKWQLGVVLFAVGLSIIRGNLLFLFIAIFAYSPTVSTSSDLSKAQTIKLVTTDISIKDKWNPNLLPNQIGLVIKSIQDAIKSKKSIIVFPESALPLFLNKDEALLTKLKNISKDISIVVGALNLDDGVPRNSTYIFHNGEVKIADKVILVPFGEQNPLPDWLGKWVNKIFYDDAVDYQASDTIGDYMLGGTLYRNAICYEACNQRLYRGNPKNMIVLSNNGWFTPSIEPTQQRLLLQYYSRKYGTTIYHSINMSPSYIIKNGNVIWKATTKQRIKTE